MDDRKVRDVEPPPRLPLSSQILWPNGKDNDPDWKALRSHSLKEGRLTQQDCLHLISRTTAVLSKEPNLLRLQDPIIVVGDIHGQFFDLVRLLEIGGDPGGPDNTTQYLFLGDYVDRGSFSIEVLLVLMSMKLCFPQSVWMLRGNHECRQMTTFFNFRDECEYKYNLSVYAAFTQLFDTLPLAAILNGKFLALHGGISPHLIDLETISQTNRFQEPPRTGLFCDLLWADPADEEREEALMATRTSADQLFYPNDVRGCSYFFTFSAAKAFLDRCELLSIIRAHEAQLEGFKMHRENRSTHFPSVITIFSAPNYCDCYNNKGAILNFDRNTLNIQQFNFSPHPYYLPNFMDVFTWSLPFVSEKVTEMLYAIVNPTLEGDYGDDDDDDFPLPDEIQRVLREPCGSGDGTALDSSLDAPPRPGTLSKERAEALRNKVVAVGRLCYLLRTLREEHELIVRLKGLTPGHRIPPGALLEGAKGLHDELQKFQSAKELDAVNERRPPASRPAQDCSDL